MGEAREADFVREAKVRLLVIDHMGSSLAKIGLSHMASLGKSAALASLLIDYWLLIIDR